MGKYLMIAAFLAILAGCGKSNSHSNYFTIQLGSNSYSFDSIAAQVDTSRGPYITTIYAKNTQTGSILQVSFQSNVPTLKGVYSHLLPTPSTSILIIFSIFIHSGPSLFTYAIEGTPFTLTVDQANNNSMHASFSGTLSGTYNAQDSVTATGQFETGFAYQPL